MTETKIEWADSTLNLWWGCTKVSQGCKHCYAEHLADGRFGRNNWGPSGTRQEVKSWRATLAQIAAKAKASDRRLRVFVNSMSDTFEGPETMGGRESQNWSVVSRLQDELLDAILEHPELDFLLLTKRPQNVLDVVHRHDGHDTTGHNWKWPSNLWLGTSVEDQATAEERILHLLKCPAAVRFLSCEPLLGAVDLQRLTIREGRYIDCLSCYSHDGEGNIIAGPLKGTEPVDWVIVGGESGPNARPMNTDWARSLRDQCQAAGVAFFFKQGSSANWPRYKDFDAFPPELQAREFPVTKEPR